MPARASWDGEAEAMAALALGTRHRLFSDWGSSTQVSSSATHAVTKAYFRFCHKRLWLPMVTTLARFELLALRLYVHGPEAAERRPIRALARSPLWLETRCLLRSHGFSEAEIATLMQVHPQGCACWKCVMALYRAVRRRSFVRN